jgi:hypothetical protein
MKKKESPAPQQHHGSELQQKQHQALDDNQKRKNNLGLFIACVGGAFMSQVLMTMPSAWLIARTSDNELQRKVSWPGLFVSSVVTVSDIDSYLLGPFLMSKAYEHYSKNKEEDPPPKKSPK